MIDIHCDCGTPLRAAEAEANLAIACPKCHKTLRPVSAEQLPDGAGAADFDTRLVVTEGPGHVGDQLLLGGCMEIELGKQPERHVPLPGKMVSRNHCKLVRLDFGPSRWKLVDNKSTNGCFVNGSRVYEHELRDGDEITVGDYTLKFMTDAARPAPAPMKAIPIGGPTCPSCNQPLPPNTKICVECGIYIDTGKPLVLSKGFDEDSMAETSDTWIRIVSWVIPFGLFPVASEAYGTRKAYVTWAITVITIVASIAYFPVLWRSESYSDAGTSLNLMHWYGSREATIEENRAAVEIEWRERQQRQAAQRQPAVAGQVAPPAPAAKKAEPVKPTTADVEQWLMDEEELPPKDVGFRWYQLITHALLHADIMHLAGNLLFLIVFGLRVNELIGNIAAAIVYPILAIGSALIESMVHASEPLGAGLGASGAIMGLAGMYFIFFPTQKVHMAIWFRGGMLTGWRCFYKVWTMGGFWLLLLWIGFNDILPTLIGSAEGDGVAHWAHLGGFMLGMAIAVGLLLARMTNARGGDLLSVTLGKRAWALVGKPTSRKDPAPTPRAVSLNYGG